MLTNICPNTKLPLEKQSPFILGFSPSFRRTHRCSSKPWFTLRQWHLAVSQVCFTRSISHSWARFIIWKFTSLHSPTLRPSKEEMKEQWAACGVWRDTAGTTQTHILWGLEAGRSFPLRGRRWKMPSLAFWDLLVALGVCSLTPRLCEEKRSLRETWVKACHLVGVFVQFGLVSKEEWVMAFSVLLRNREAKVL